MPTKANTVAFLHFKCNILNDHIGAEHLFMLFTVSIAIVVLLGSYSVLLYRKIVFKSSKNRDKNHALRAKNRRDLTFLSDF